MFFPAQKPHLLIALRRFPKMALAAASSRSPSSGRLAMPLTETVVKAVWAGTICGNNLGIRIPRSSVAFSASLPKFRLSRGFSNSSDRRSQSTSWSLSKLWANRDGNVQLQRCPTKVSTCLTILQFTTRENSFYGKSGTQSTTGPGTQGNFAELWLLIPRLTQTETVLNYK